MNGHTPGPWVTYLGGCHARASISSTEGHVASCTTRNAYPPHHKCIDVAEMQANARLIAAAPDLLDAAILGLREAEGWVHDQLDGTKTLARALAELQPIRDAIAKATGAQP